MANAQDIAQVKQQITEKINSVSGNIRAINNFTQYLNQALRFLTTKITELKVQGTEGQQRAQQLYEELNAILDQLNGIDEVSPDFVNAINYTKQDIMVDDLTEKAYNPFLVNRQLSYFQDTAIVANEMNKYHQIDNLLQFQFLLNIVRKRKRFSKWIKPTREDDVEAIKEYYGYSNEKAQRTLDLLSPEQIVVIKGKVNKGGRK